MDVGLNLPIPKLGLVLPEPTGKFEYFRWRELLDLSDDFCRTHVANVPSTLSLSTLLTETSF